MRSLIRRMDVIREPGPKIVDPYRGPALEPVTTAPDHRKAMERPTLSRRRRSRDRLHLIYPDIEPEAARQARALLSLVVASDQDAAGAWVPARDLARLYREHRKTNGLPRLSWTAIARHLKRFAPKKLAKRNGRRRVWYRVPCQLEKAELTP
jgi:hypothetical protein